MAVNVEILAFELTVTVKANAVPVQPSGDLGVI